MFMKHLWSFLYPYRTQTYLGIGAIFVTNLFAVTIPWLLGLSIEILETDHQTVITLVLIMILLAILQAFFRIKSRTLIFLTARNAEHNLRIKLFEHLMLQSPSYYRKHMTGDMLSRMTNDIQTVRLILGFGFLTVVNAFFVFILSLILMISIDLYLTILALLPFPFFIIIINKIFASRIFNKSRELQHYLGKTSAQIHEDLLGINTIKLYALESNKIDTITTMSETLLKKNIALMIIRSQMVPIVGSIAAISTALLLWQGGIAVIEEAITLGQLIQLTLYVALLVFPSLAVALSITLFHRSLSAWNRINALFTDIPTIVQNTKHNEKEYTFGDIEIKNLTIAIEEQELIHNISLTIPKGSFTAIVGKTGSGKSLIAESIARLQEVDANMIFVGQKDITTWPLKTLRQHIGYAPQEAWLFSSTITRNIEQGIIHTGKQTPEETEQRIKNAASVAGLDRDLQTFPNGLDTLVGERGITLSGGQKQRVALARAIASDPHLLILDDALSSIDVDTEKIILDKLRDTMEGRTVILISHRIPAIAHADQIVVLDNGKLAELGTHTALLQKQGLYHDLYHSSIAEQRRKNHHA